MKQNTMKAVAIDHFGGLDAMKVQNVPVPDVGSDEVLIHVESAGVGVWDPFEREGGFAEEFHLKPQFPHVLGSDGAGVVEAVGDRVKRLKKGDRAYAISLMNPKGGFYAQYAAVKEENAAPVPATLSTEEAGAMPVDAVTALEGLDHVLQIKAGETLMIIGASGGIGHMAVQLAKRMGARVFAVASGSDGVELVKRLGADEAVEGHHDVAAEARRFAPQGMDAALVTIGGEDTEKALQAVKEGGRIAYPNGVEPEPKPRQGIQIQSYNGMPRPETFEKLNQLIQAGPFEVHIAKVFPLDQAVEAQKALDSHYLGKLALVPA